MRKNRICSGATDAEIAAVAKDWFRFPKDRQGGRKQREEKKRKWNRTGHNHTGGAIHDRMKNLKKILLTIYHENTYKFNL